jgi:NTE family protein
MRSGTVGSEAQRRIVRQQCDYLIEPPMPDIGLRDWKKFDRAIQEGYDTARACIDRDGMSSALMTGEGPEMPLPHVVVAT